MKRLLACLTAMVGRLLFMIAPARYALATDAPDDDGTDDLGLPPPLDPLPPPREGGDTPPAPPAGPGFESTSAPVDGSASSADLSAEAAHDEVMSAMEAAMAEARAEGEALLAEERRAGEYGTEEANHNSRWVVERDL